MAIPFVEERRNTEKNDGAIRIEYDDSTEERTKSQFPLFRLK